MSEHERPGSEAQPLPSSNATASEGDAGQAPPRTRAPSHAERCRTLVAAARSATLSTLARDPAGFPYGSLVTVASTPRAARCSSSRSLAEHTQNLDRTRRGLDPRRRGRRARRDAARRSAASRCSAPAAASPTDERDAARAIFLAAHPAPPTTSTSRTSPSIASTRSRSATSAASGACRG